MDKFSVILIATVTSLFIIVFTWFPCWSHAKDADLEIVFSMESPETVNYYELYCIKVPGSGVKDLVATLDSTGSVIWDVEEAVWSIDVTDIPPGKTLDWYLHSIDMEGAIGYSPAYQFKLTGNPFLISIKVVK